MRSVFWISLAAASCAVLGVAAACSSSSSPSDSDAPAVDAASTTDSSSSADAEDAAVDHAITDVNCDAAIIECTTAPTRTSPTVNDPPACGAPAFDAYATNDNEQVEAACNTFCQDKNPAYADAGGFIGCNQSAAEQALGTGAFHCVCAP